MKTRLTLWLLFICTGCLFAQNQDEQTAIYKHDLGFNTSIILQGIFSSNSTPFSLMYKKYTAENKALRLGVTTSLTLSPASGNSLSNNNYAVPNNVSISVSLGKEKQNKINKKWMWYYGGDIIPGYTYNQSDTYSQANDLIQTTYSTNLTLAARPFTGVRFDISTRLYVSTEFSVNLVYRSASGHTENFTSGQIVDQKITSLTLGLFPASSIFFFYRF